MLSHTNQDPNSPGLALNESSGKKQTDDFDSFENMNSPTTQNCAVKLEAKK